MAEKAKRAAFAPNRFIILDIVTSIRKFLLIFFGEQASAARLDNKIQKIRQIPCAIFWDVLRASCFNYLIKQISVDDISFFIVEKMPLVGSPWPLSGALIALLTIQQTKNFYELQ